MAAVESNDLTHDKSRVEEQTTVVTPPKGLDDLIEVASQVHRPQDLTPELVKEMTEWAMADDEEDVEEQPFPIEVDMAIGAEPPDKKVLWAKPISSTRVDELRRMCTVGNRSARRAARGEPDQIDTTRLNAYIVFESCVVPDFREVAQKKQVPDGAVVVLHRFRGRTMLVDQIATAILEASGGDLDKVSLGVRAAKN